jgi:hypothetical protein
MMPAASARANTFPFGNVPSRTASKATRFILIFPQATARRRVGRLRPTSIILKLGLLLTSNFKISFACFMVLSYVCF